ncbi:hypothetical protein FA13DRAFT_1893988 [Coprinellus micaceus]|uniref:Uncharacterized protein n=1 Tax=Coprinellus micaceus TaxID=71717 RepID=A0A4Y7TS83_COPMI|nr:hypothetical protein FA13DRAFT_1893988 [Coprinellus micaceus]
MPSSTAFCEPVCRLRPPTAMAPAFAFALCLAPGLVHMWVRPPLTNVDVPLTVTGLVPFHHPAIRSRVGIGVRVARTPTSSGTLRKTAGTPHIHARTPSARLHSTATPQLPFLASPGSTDPQNRQDCCISSISTWDGVEAPSAYRRKRGLSLVPGYVKFRQGSPNTNQPTFTLSTQPPYWPTMKFSIIATTVVAAFAQSLGALAGPSPEQPAARDALPAVEASNPGRTLRDP